MVALGNPEILYVWPDKFKGDEERQKQIDSLGFNTHYVSPTLLSAFTSMTIATECTNRNVRLVHTFRPQDAMAAISARKISKNRDFKIALEFPDNAPRPRSLAKDIVSGVDAWIFATDRLADIASSSQKPCLVISPSLTATGSLTLPASAEKAQHLLWAGPLEKNIDNLKAAIRLVADSGGTTRLSVLGTGSARYAMQAVKMARVLPDPTLVRWLGDTYALDTLMPEITAIVQSQPDPTPYELDLASRLSLCQATPGGLMISYIEPLSAYDRARRLSDFYRKL